MTSIAVDIRKLSDLGIGDYIRNLLHQIHLSNSGYKYLFLHSGEAPGSLLVSDVRFSYQPVKAGGYSLKEHLEIPVILKKNKIDLYHSPHYVLPFFYRGKSVVTIHDIIHLRFPEYLKSRAAVLYARHIIHYAAKKSVAVITDSEFSKQDIIKECNIPGKKIHVIPLAVDDIFFDDYSDEDIFDIKKKYNLPGKYIFYSGNHKKHKNIEFLLEVFEALSGRIQHSLVMSGPPDPYDEILKEKFKPPAGRIKWLGRVPRGDLPVILNGSDIFLYPSRYEGFGFPPLEALAAGTPVVSSNCTSLPEVLGDGACLLPVDDAGLWVDKTLELLSDKVIRKKQIDAGRRHAGTFSWKETGARTLDVYEKFI